MTPAEARRCGLRLADALYVIADEMGRPDACQAIITAHANCAEELAEALAALPLPAHTWLLSRWCEPAALAAALRSPEGLPAARLIYLAGRWRAWAVEPMPGDWCFSANPNLDADGICTACHKRPRAA